MSKTNLKSLSATELSKMVFCEMNVIKKQKTTIADAVRIAKGNNAHDVFEKHTKIAQRSNSEMNKYFIEPINKSIQQTNQSKYFSIKTVIFWILFMLISFYFLPL